MESIIELYIHSKTAINLIVNILEEVEYKKGEKLVTLEKKTYDMFFIKKGITRSYYIDEKEGLYQIFIGHSLKMDLL